jgi:hypothetical protein
MDIEAYHEANFKEGIVPFLSNKLKLYPLNISLYE